LNSEVGKEDNFKPTIGNESLHDINNDYRVRVVNFDMFKNLTVRSIPHHNIHKFTWTPPDGKPHNQIELILIMVLMRIFEPRRNEVTGDWRKLRNEELHKLYSLSSIIIMIKSRGLRWAGHVE
jgi:hypothetical protein